MYGCRSSNILRQVLERPSVNAIWRKFTPILMFSVSCVMNFLLYIKCLSPVVFEAKLIKHFIRLLIVLGIHWGPFAKQ